MSGHILALSGGVGGAKLAAGLAAVLPPERLTVAVNTGDDFEHLGLTVCPDIDSVIYAMAGLNDRQRGWGMANETWHMMEQLRALGEEDWFNLGDRDLATHISRSWRLRQGESLSAITERQASALGIAHRVVPMSEDQVRTQVNCSGQWTDFQRWFVGEQCGPKVDAIRFAGTPGARMSEGLAEALARPDLVAVVFCPSNPFLSVDPILAVDGVREALLALQVPRIAVSPLIGGKALKGPLSKLLAEMGLSGNNRDVANHYGPILTHFVIDRSDAADAEELTGLALTVTDTLMRSAEDQTRLAGEVLAAVSI